MKSRYMIIFLTVYALISAAPIIEGTEFSGFLESGLGKPVSSKEYQQQNLTLAEARMQLQADTILSDLLESRVKVDFYRDEVFNEWKLEARDAYALYYPSSLYEVKAGRQVLTWGTGDLIFINDRFPKDYESFYSGRSMEYLKVPSDAVKLSFFPKDYILDIVFIPFFTPNRVVNGKRLTFFDQSTREFVKTGKDHIDAEEPSNSIENTQVALRVKKYIGGNEFALYGYDGYYLDPNPKNNGDGYEYSESSVFGTSWIGNFAGGIANSEIGYEHSKDDSSGDKSNVTNSYLKLLLGYKREILTDFTLGIQFYLEHMTDYNSYKSSLTEESMEYARHENRSIFTLRLTKLFMQQQLKCEFFTFYSPTDEDGYINPDISYDWSDGVNTSLGMNIFYGKYDYTDFAQLEDNTSIYMRIRYSF